jgi:hypothetical protein
MQVSATRDLVCFCDRLKKVTWGEGAKGGAVSFVVECSGLSSGAVPAVPIPDLVPAGVVTSGEGGLPVFGRACR